MASTRKIAVDRGPNAKLRIVWGRGSNQRYLGEEFFNEECNDDQRSKFKAVFEIAADTGFVRNPKLYKWPLNGCGNVGEFKTFKKRLFFYRQGNDLIVTHGATKKTDATDPLDIERAIRIQREIESEEEQLRERDSRERSQRGRER
ncbi:type II toxin-antitoxin system RelE/ParE family toxin [Myxococcaceae bacterium GXIMD 01537]